MKTIVLVGGGTGGSVSPLLAVADSIKVKLPYAKFLFIGGRGIEKQMVEKYGIDFVALPSGKFRRYWSLQNLFTPFLVALGFLMSLVILRRIRPSVIFGTGSFAQVPVMYAAWFLHIPIIIHQQDVLPSLANTLCAPIAKKITVSFEPSVKNFFQGLWLPVKKSEDKIIYTGNPCRLKKEDLPSQSETLETFGVRKNFPTLLVLGGGTGAAAINKLIWDNLGALLRYVNILHLTGKGKSVKKIGVSASQGYFQREFTDDMLPFYSAGDMVLCRAGLSTITELSMLGKVALVVPIPDSHQMYNARFLDEAKAAVVLNQKLLNGEMLVWTIRRILHSEAYKALSILMDRLIPKDAAEKVAKTLLEINI